MFKPKSKDKDDKKKNSKDKSKKSGGNPFANAADLAKKKK